jgi:hypothetical protein
MLLSHLRLPQPGGPDTCIYIPQEQGGPVTPPGTAFPFRRVLRIAGLRLRYSNPPQYDTHMHTQEVIIKDGHLLLGYQMVQMYIEHCSIEQCFYSESDNSNGECCYRIGFLSEDADNSIHSHNKCISPNFPNNSNIISNTMHFHPNQN